MIFDKPITVERQDPETEEWAPVWALHAEVNKAGAGGQTSNAGADQYAVRLTFRLRHFAALDELRFNPQPFRIIYRGHAFKVVDYDDYFERRTVVTITGAAYG